MWRALRNFAGELTGDVRVVVVRGEGRAFSAGLDRAVLGGGDFTDLAALPDDRAADRILGFQEAFTWLRRPDLITIAAVQGYAIGAGFQLALGCDLRILADDAKLAMAEVTLGLVPDLGGTKRLVELIGYARALELCVTGRRVAADEAATMGLANLVVPAADLPSATADLVAAVLSGNRDAVIEIKALLATAADRTYPDADRAEREAQVRRAKTLFGTGD
ncbi:enoyl-CoA hydratase/carnithine racemase [Catenuloplanes atrovinosus]|uniref:Enoyl-CoA hydratase/carnithine racemase n=2 Tax=Catenuloplanes atrovinosus TaxID=137266 RepID=A0AAE3YTB4_9ACTN|nr:enoyl-CoA hydratase/carnithine racemase [Catenuloplanes atrovinosus]